MSQHIDTRRKLKSVSRMTTFDQILDSCTLSDEEKEILHLYYIQKKDFGYIADTMGYALRTIKDKHKAALIKIADVL